MSRSWAAVTVALALSLAGFPSARATITPVNYPVPLAEAGAVSGDITNIVFGAMFGHDETLIHS